MTIEIHFLSCVCVSVPRKWMIYTPSFFFLSLVAFNAFNCTLFFALYIWMDRLRASLAAKRATVAKRIRPFGSCYKFEKRSGGDSIPSSFFECDVPEREEKRLLCIFRFPPLERFDNNPVVAQCERDCKKKKTKRESRCFGGCSSLLFIF